MVFINRRTNPEKIEQLETRIRTPGQAVPDFEVRSLMTRIEDDCAQVKIIVNYLEDNVLKKRVVRKGLSSRPCSSV
jgi:hypothetical protein